VSTACGVRGEDVMRAIIERKEERKEEREAHRNHIDCSVSYNRASQYHHIKKAYQYILRRHP
jgi:hypothetical protein